MRSAEKDFPLTPDFCNMSDSCELARGLLKAYGLRITGAMGRLAVSDNQAFPHEAH